MVERSLTKMAGQARRQIRLAIARAVVRLIDPDGALQRLQVSLLADEARDGVEQFEGYGLTAHPHAGAEAICLHVGGARAHPVVIAVADRRYRVTGLAAGEVCLYDDQGQRITLYRDRIEVEAPSVVIQSPDVHLGTTGGARIARVGDRVQVGSGSSAGLWPIVEGSEMVRSA